MSESFPTAIAESPANGGFDGGGGNRTRETFPTSEAVSQALDLVREARRLGGRKTWIYFIQQDDGPVKIGVADEPFARLGELQVGNPHTLHLRGIYHAPAALERVLHKRFFSSRLRGEWFEPHSDLLAIADALHAVSIEQGATWA